MDDVKHLWEVEHPYYWTEGAYFAKGYHSSHETWAAFLEEMDAADADLNLVCRWDWALEKEEDLETPVQPIGKGTLQVRYVLQRKGICMSHDVQVGPEDEPAVRAWLQAKWDRMKRLWEPFTERT